MRWLKRLLGTETLAEQIESLTRAQYLILSQDLVRLTIQINAKLDALDVKLSNIQEMLSFVNQANQANQANLEGQVGQNLSAIRNTRPSWPRMRKLLEEDDIRHMVDRTEEYWKNKQQQSKEG